MVDRFSISAILGILIAGMIIYLIRKDHLHSRYAMWWIPMATGIAAVGFFPEAVDWTGQLAQIHYPPILPLIVAIGFVMIKILLMDIERSRNERKLHRLAQQMALLEEKAGIREEDDEVDEGLEE